jgi:hypothetical protein
VDDEVRPPKDKTTGADAADRRIGIEETIAEFDGAFSEGTVRNMTKDGRLPFFDGIPLTAWRSEVRGARVISWKIVTGSRPNEFKVPSDGLDGALRAGVIQPPLKGKYFSLGDVAKVREWLARPPPQQATPATLSAEEIAQDIAAERRLLEMGNNPLRAYFEDQLRGRKLARTRTR